jgi:hypothetical protein
MLTSKSTWRECKTAFSMLNIEVCEEFYTTMQPTTSILKAWSKAIAVEKLYILVELNLLDRGKAIKLDNYLLMDTERQHHEDFFDLHLEDADTLDNYMEYINEQIAPFHLGVVLKKANTELKEIKDVLQ